MQNELCTRLVEVSAGHAKRAKLCTRLPLWVCCTSVAGHRTHMAAHGILLAHGPPPSALHPQPQNECHMMEVEGMSIYARAQQRVSRHVPLPPAGHRPVSLAAVHSRAVAHTANGHLH